MIRIFIADENPFHLPEPPAWWQQLVYDYDKMLRILPSHKDRLYRLARVARREARLGIETVAGVQQHPDTTMLARYGLVPVSTVFPWAVYSTKILRDLRARDLWADITDTRSFEQYMADIEGREAAAEARREQQYADDLDQRNSEAFRFIKTAAGERLYQNDDSRGRRGKTFGTDRTRVKVALGRGLTISSSKTSSAAPGGPSEKTSALDRQIVLTDAR